MVTSVQHNVAVLYPLKSVSADDNMNCFYQILMISNVYIVLVETLNGIDYECFTILIIRMMTRHVLIFSDLIIINDCSNLWTVGYFKNAQSIQIYLVMRR